MVCQTIPQVGAYHDNELSSADRAAVEAHLASCAQCRQALAEFQRISAMLGQAPLPEMPRALPERVAGAMSAARDRSLRRIAGWLTTAAAAVLVIGLLPLPWNRAASSAVVTRPAPLDVSAVMPPIDVPAENAVPTVEVAQWMAEELASADQRGMP